MKIRFSKEVRKSLATQLIRASWGGSGAFTVLGVTAHSGIVILATGAWWVLAQVIAHIILALEEEKPQKK